MSREKVTHAHPPSCTPTSPRKNRIKHPQETEKTMAVRRVPPLAIRWGLLLLVVCALLASFTIAASVPQQGTGMAPSDERGLQKIMAMLGTARKSLPPRSPSDYLDCARAPCLFVAYSWL
eukprot:1658266-Rhodomonas_salina.2